MLMRTIQPINGTITGNLMKMLIVLSPSYLSNKQKETSSLGYYNWTPQAETKRIHLPAARHSTTLPPRELV
jgi:hypothetical protein